MPLLTSPQPLIRLTDANYGDGIGAPTSGVDPVSISANLFDQDGVVANSAGLSNLFVAWGQFTDHDLSLSPEGHNEVLTAPGLVAPLARSDYILGEDGARIPLNAITWQMDGSQIYGSTAERLADVRSFEGGMLRTDATATSEFGLLPGADPDSFMAGDITSDTPVYLAGDVRANENPALASVHTLMVREHNYWAGRLAEAHPDWNDQQIFDGARSIVEVELQQITYNEWLPHLLGDAVGSDGAYDPDTIGQVSVEFSTAGFRVGHTLVSSQMPSLNEDGSFMDGGDRGIMELFFNPEPIREDGIDGVLRGQTSTFAQEVDTQVVDDLNFFLSSPAGLTGFSLVGLNLLRGQDHGLQSYVDTRAALLGDIDPATLDPHDFSIITADPDLQAQLAEVYPTVFDVQLWVGGLAEDAIDGTQLGPLFTFIDSDQFIRTRAADETFGQLDPNLGADIIAEVRAGTLSDIITRNTDIDTIQDDPFVAAARGLTDSASIWGTWGGNTIALSALRVAGDVYAGGGDDAVTLTGGTRIEGNVRLGCGDDSYVQSSGTVTGNINAGFDAGNDLIVLSGSATAERHIMTADGNDTVVLAGQSRVNGVIATGEGDDSVSLGARVTATDIRLGAGDDRVEIAHGAQVSRIVGGDGHDTLHVTGGNYRVDWTGPQAGRIVFLDDSGTEIGSTRFSGIEGVTCFTPGTRIIAAGGMRLIENIAVGDLVMTLDAGLQPVRWIGRTTVPAIGNLAPIRIAAQTLGNSRDLLVSPQHRMLLDDWRCDVFCGQDSMLAAAKHLVNDQTIRPAPGGLVDYIHILFDDHQIIFAEGIASESFHPGAVGLTAMDTATRDELLALFPVLANDLTAYGPAARYHAKPHEVRLVMARAAAIAPEA